MSGVNATKVSRDSAIRWKFNQLNTNKNNVLERSEWKTYKSALLEWKNVRQCSRNLFKTCDLDRDRKLTFDEWRKCIVQGEHSESIRIFQLSNFQKSTVSRRNVLINSTRSSIF